MVALLRELVPHQEFSTFVGLRLNFLAVFLFLRLRTGAQFAEQAQRDRVFFGATVTYVTERDEEVTVSIVGVDEADMGAGKISIGSPVALALLRARRGDEVSVRTPRGPEMLEIVNIRYPDRRAAP